MTRDLCLFAVSSVLMLLNACEQRREAPVRAVEMDEAPLQLHQLLLNSESGVLELPFAKVIEQVTGRQILPVDQTDAVTLELLDAIGEAVEVAIAEFNRPDSPVKRLRRINEASRLFENALLASIAAADAFTALSPPTAAGKVQRSGYPDIKVVHITTERVFYLDPKLYEASSENSSLRSFYFTPKRETNKVLNDACHLLLGITHDGNEGNWAFTGWKLVDLSELTVRLKPEFQASNRDLYVPGATIRHRKITE